MRFPSSCAGLCAAAILLLGCGRSPQEKRARHIKLATELAEKKDYPRAILEFKNALQISGSDAELRYQLALAYLASGNTRSAVGELQQATEINPKHTGAQVKLAALMATTYNTSLLEDAEKRIKGVLDAGTETVEALNTLSAAEWKLGKREDAERHLKEAFDKYPQHLASSVALARLQLSKKDVAGAEATLKRVAGQQPPSADAMVALGDFYAKFGRIEEAREEFERALQVNPKHGIALLDIAALHIHAGRVDEAQTVYKRLSQLPGIYKPVHAAFLLKNGKHDEAIAEFQSHFREAPEDRNARTRLLGALLYTKRTSEAERILADVLQKNPKDVDALLQRGRIFLAAARLPEAQADLQRVLQLRPDSGEAHFLMAGVYRGKGLPFNEKQELGEALWRDPSYLSARVRLAAIHLGENAPQAALGILDAAPATQRADVRMVTQRNWALLMMQQHAEARKGVNAVLDVRRDDVVLTQDAMLKMDARDYPGARAALEQALAQNPENVSAVNLLAQTYSLQKQNAAAVQKVRQYAAARPGSAPLQKLLGEWLLANGDRVQARAAFEAGRKANPNYTAVRLALAELDYSEGKRDSLRESLMKLIEDAPGESKAHLMLAVVEENTGNVERAIEHYKKVNELDTQNVMALNNLAYLLSEHTRDLDMALTLAQRAKELAPNSAVVDDTLGWITYRKGLYTTAVQFLERAAKEPTARRMYHLAMASYKAGQHSRGRRALEEGLKLDPNLPEAQFATQMIRR